MRCRRVKRREINFVLISGFPPHPTADAATSADGGVVNNGTFIMTGGVIENCTAIEKGDACFVSYSNILANGGDIHGMVYVSGTIKNTSSDSK